MSEMAKKPLKVTEQLARLRQAQSEHVGPITFRQLLARFGTAEKALAALPALAKRGGLRKTIRLFPKDQAREIFEEVSGMGCFFLFLGDDLYPEALAALEDAPPYLIAKGHAHLLGRKTLAVVGTRNASINGQRFSQELANQLGEQGFVIVSGLARGIDAHAHIGALETGTIAVLGGGIDVYYPRENRALQDKIAENGLLLTEHTAGAKPQPQNFPRRNRIISGLSLGVVVVEAALRSGSLITARLALEQGREVFAVPGHPMDPRAKGPNSLIRSSALLIESAEDILEALKERLRTPLSDPTKDLFDGWEEAAQEFEIIEETRDLVVQMLSPSPTPVDDLLRHGNLTASLLLTILLELELAGQIRRHPGNQVSLI